MKFFFNIKDMNHKNFAILQKHIAATENVEQYKKGWLYYPILVCVITVVFHLLTENLKKDRAHVLSQDSACTARTQMLSERWWIRLNLYARFLAQTSFFL